MSEDRERCTAAGMDDFLAKPLQLPDLERCLSLHAARVRVRVNAVGEPA